MARGHKRSYRRKSHRRSHKRGGGAASPSTYSSESTYNLRTAGNGQQQFDNTFGPGAPSGAGNALRGLQGQVAGSRRRRSSRSRRGGFFGQVLSQAVVPLSLLGLQQSYRRKGRGTRRNSRRR